MRSEDSTHPTALTISPLAILQLHEALHDDDFVDHIPEVWWNAVRRTGSRRMAEAGLTIPPIESLTRASADRQDVDEDESFVAPAASTSLTDRSAAARRVVSQITGRSQAMSDGTAATSAFHEWTFEIPVHDSERCHSQGVPIPPDAEPVKLVVTWQSARGLRVVYVVDGGCLALDLGTTLAAIEWSDAAGRSRGTGSQSNSFVPHVEVHSNGEQPSTGDRIKFTYQNKAGWQLEITVTIP